MFGSGRVLHLAGVSAIIGGSLWLVALERHTAILGLVLCGAAAIAMALGSWEPRRSAGLGVGLVLCGTLTWLLAWLCRDSLLLLATSVVRTESGQAITVLRHTLGELAGRDLFILPFVVVGVGLLSTPQTRRSRWSVGALRRMIGGLHLALGVALAWEYYLDAITPPSLYAALKLALGLGWVALGYLLVTHPYRAPVAAQQAASRP
ncbi:hypothetical protein [Kallotenue papyrolyticum]|uniref:hypothetical protein n=1 Tax=Kallotenue papyrolyticum TaxID=1325125 RepID=UPI0004714BCE|nr:hypothetical protein [Kallotenue papyrolyticum]